MEAAKAVEFDSGSGLTYSGVSRCQGVETLVTLYLNSQATMYVNLDMDVAVRLKLKMRLVLSLSAYRPRNIPSRRAEPKEEKVHGSEANNF